MRSPGPVDFLLLFLLSLAWASIYVLVKVAEHDFPAICLMALRALSATVCLLVVALVTRRSLRATRSQHLLMATLSVLNVSFIWVAISVAEEHMASGLTALMTALVPIGTFLLTAFVLRTERPDWKRMLGLGIALAGLVLVLDPARIMGRSAEFAGVAMMAAGSLGYAGGGLLAARHAHSLHPVVLTTWSLGYATLTLAALSFLLEKPLQAHPTSASWLAVVAAGCLATALPNLIYYHLIAEVGAQFAALFGYLVPVLGVVLGVVLMHETVTAGLVPGIALTLAGVALVKR